MFNITIANNKGGSGKTTTANLLGSEIYASGGSIIILEGDPNRPHARWAEKRGFPVIEGPKTSISNTEEASLAIADAMNGSRLLVITTDGDEGSVLDWIEAAAEHCQFLICDPEGSPNQWLQLAVSQADMVLIPFAPTTLDADQVQATIKSLKQTERMSGRKIDYRVMLTKASNGAVRTRDENELRDALTKNNTPMLTVALADRPAFRGVFKHNKMLSELDEADAGGLHRARENSKAFAAEVIGILKTKAQQVAA